MTITEIIEKIKGMNADVTNIVNAYPVDLLAILEALKIGCYYAENIENNADGKYCPNENNILINKNKKGKSDQIRMIIAHELGHYIHQHEGQLFKGNDVNYSENELIQEKEANDFANELLMPERKFIEKFKEYKNNEQKDKKEIMTSLANFFFVPIENVKARAYNIGLIENLFV